LKADDFIPFAQVKTDGQTKINDQDLWKINFSIETNSGADVTVVPAITCDQYVKKYLISQLNAV